MKRKLNIKWFLWLTGGIIVVGAVFHGVHVLRAEQTATGLLRSADQAKKNKDVRKEMDYLGRYLKFRPGETDALARFGMILDDQSVKNPRLCERAMFVLDQVLRRDPDYPDVRRKVVGLAMRMRSFGDAKTHLAVLMAAGPKDGELYHLLGTCEASTGKYAEAVKALEKAIEYPPREVESYVLLAAVLWRKREEAEKPDKVMEKMVKEKKSVRAYLARAAYLRERSKGEPAVAKQEAFLKKAGEDIAAARQLAPDDIDVLLESAEWQLAQTQPGDGPNNNTYVEKARAEVEHALKVHPKAPRLYLLLSRVERLLGNSKEAIACLHRGLKEIPVAEQGDVLFILADLLIDQGSLSEVGEFLDRLRELHFAPTPMRFLDACVLVKAVKGDKWPEAARALEAIRPAVAEWPQLSTRVEFLLGQSYEQLGDPDQQYAAYRRALTADPLSMPALVGMGRALAAMGRPDDAIDALRRLMPRVPEVKLMVVRLMVERNLGLPKNQQNWDEVDVLLKELEPAVRNSPVMVTELYLMKAEATVARGDLSRTRDLLMEAREKQPDKVDTWIALANLASKKPQGGVEEAAQIIEEAEKKFGDRVEIRLARAWQLRRGGKEAPEALVRLTEGMEKFNAGDKSRMLRECAKFCAVLGDLDRAEQLFRRQEILRPYDLTIKLALFDLALNTGNHQAADALIAGMRAIEVAPGTRWRYAKASLLISRALKSSDREGLDEARASLSALAVERPNWYRVAVSQGQIHELMGKREAAIAQYLQAVEMGERRPSVINRLCLLLYQSQRYADAAKVIHKLPEGTTLLGDMRLIAVDLSLRSQDYNQALALAEKAVRENAKDYRNHLWLAQVYLSMSRQEQAEPEMREAVALASDVPETWVVLVQFLVFTGQKEKAATEIANAAKKLSAKQAPLGLAQCYDAIGNREQANLHYQKALAAQSEDLPTLQRAADFYVRGGQMKEAEKYLRQFIALQHKDPDAAASARRILAMVVVLGGENYQKSREALVNLGMLTDSGKAFQPGDETIEQLRAKAMTLALLRHRPDRLAAIRILSQMRDRQPLTVSDRLLLAQLQESVGDWAKARVELSALVDKDGKNFLYLTRLALGLLRHGESEAVPPLVAKLEEHYAASAATAEIKARLLHAQGKAPQAVHVLRQFADKNENALLPVAAMLEEFKQMQAAEDSYRQFVSRSKSAESPLLLARYLGRQGRLDEALEICEKAASACRAEMIAAATLNILYSAKPNKDHCRRVERLLTAAIEKERTVILLDYLGAFHNLQENFAGAEVAFRAALALDANDPTALNNLSWLLAFQLQKNAEALQLAQKAIRTIGPYSGILDTRGVIHLNAGRVEQAVKDLEDVAAEGPTASHYFHLAQVHHMAKNRIRATEALTEANRLGLAESVLHPLERAAYQQLCAQLGVEKK